MRKKIFVTGRSGVGKSTLIEESLRRFNGPTHGFYTTELIEGDKRAGYNLNIINGPTRCLAHVNFSGAQRVGKYGVDLQMFEDYVIPELEKGMQQGSRLIIDEIGKMELLSIRFKRTVLKAARGDYLILATVMAKPHPLIDQLKDLKDLHWLTITEENRVSLMYEIVRKMSDPDA